MQDISADTLIKASKGNIGAFEIIYKNTSSFVYNVAFRITGNKHDAEEAAQEVFLIVYYKLKNFRFESYFKTWVYRITVNCAINYSKRIFKQANRIKEYGENLSHLDPAINNPEPGDNGEDQEEIINSALSILNPEQKACIILRDIEGLSYKDIAESLQVNINTVRTRLKRARERLLSLRKEGKMFIHKFKLIIFLSISALALITPLVYASSNLPERKPQRGNEFKEEMEARRNQFYEGLGLTDGQKKVLEENRKKYREKEEALFREMREKMELIRSELQNDTLNMEIIYQINNEIKKTQAQMLDDRLEGILEVRKVLTPKQFKMFNAKMEERYRHFRERGRKAGASYIK